MVRAIFVADWDTDEPIRPFEAHEAMPREAQALRREHNFAPDTAIPDVAVALRAVADVEALERAIATLPPAAADF